jgi:S1-C subfamily serine protease
VDSHARVLGINTSALSRNVALAVPVSTVNRVVERLLEKGHMNRGYLGLGMQPVPLPQELKNALNLTADSGLIVVTVDPEGPGAKAGVLFGDVIVSFEGNAVGSVRDLQTFLEPESAGKPLAISLIRGGQAATATVTIAERKRKAD